MRCLSESFSCPYQVRLFTCVVCCSFTFNVMQALCCSIDHCIFDLCLVPISIAIVGIYKVLINESINAVLGGSCLQCVKERCLLHVRLHQRRIVVFCPDFYLEQSLITMSRCKGYNYWAEWLSSFCDHVTSNVFVSNTIHHPLSFGHKLTMQLIGNIMSSLLSGADCDEASGEESSQNKRVEEVDRDTRARALTWCRDFLSGSWKTLEQEDFQVSSVR